MADYDNGTEKQGDSAAMLAYILLLAAPLLLVTSLIGVIIAYVYRDDAPEWLRSHFQLQIRTFWLSFLLLFLGVITLVIFIGHLILLVALIWYLVRLIKGIKYLNNRQPYPNPTGWGF